MVCAYTHKHTPWTAMFHSLIPYKAIALTIHIIKSPSPSVLYTEEDGGPLRPLSSIQIPHLPRIHRAGTPGLHTRPNTGVTNLIVFLKVQ